ncbi:MAG: heme NO-binding domain-containing protein [Nannocystales bacterium]
MMGLVFTELLESAERRYGLEAVDAALAGAETSTGGSYTAVARYDHRELLRIIVGLSKETGEELGEVVQHFATDLLSALLERPEASAAAGASGTFELLEQLEPTIHATVRTLHPAAEPPRFDCVREPDGSLRVVYRSHRCLADFAAAMIRASVARFGEPILVERRALEAEVGDRHEFRLSMREEA